MPDLSVIIILAIIIIPFLVKALGERHIKRDPQPARRKQSRKQAPLPTSAPRKKMPWARMQRKTVSQNTVDTRTEIPNKKATETSVKTEKAPTAPSEDPVYEGPKWEGDKKRNSSVWIWFVLLMLIIAAVAALVLL